MQKNVNSTEYRELHASLHEHFRLEVRIWRVDIQKGVSHNFSKIIFLAKQILEVNANTIAQTIFFFQSEIFLFSIWKSKIYISRCQNGNVSVPLCKISEMWVTLFWMSTLHIIFLNENMKFGGLSKFME